MHVSFNSEMQAKDVIARELLDLDDEGEAAETIDGTYATAADVSVDLESRAGDPEFLNEARDTEIDILTGDAE